MWEGPLKGLRLSINLLPEDISRDGYDDWLLDEIAAAGIDPGASHGRDHRERAARRPGRGRRAAGALARGGVRIAVDDFGTGYTSLAYLTTLPLDMLKIDRGLIADIVGGSRDRIVVKALIQLARELDLQVVVEGVESTGQLALLVEWGCDLYQGFLGAGALTHEELTRFVAAAQVEAA